MIEVADTSLGTVKARVRVRNKVRASVRIRLGGRGRVRVRVRTIVLSVDPGIELGLTVFVSLRRYRQTNTAQALKATISFTRRTRIHA